MKRMIFFLLLWTAPAIAQVPSGEFNYAFTNTPLWDVSGTYTNNAVTNDVVISTLQHQANGQIIGTRNETYESGADHFVGNGSVTGKMFVKQGTAGWTSRSMGSLGGVEGGVSFTASFTTKGIATIIPSTLTVITAGQSKVCVVGGKCVSGSGSADVPLPATMNGDWTLDTDITATGDKLSGTATLTLSNGRVLNYQISGSYSTTTEDAKLKLTGTEDASGTSLSVTTHGTNMDLTALKGKVLGQKPTFP